MIAGAVKPDIISSSISNTRDACRADNCGRLQLM
jgi:hypothetical protein